MKAADALNVSASIAARLVRTAIWRSDACTWEITVLDRSVRSSVPRGKRELAGPFVYAGTAGIALFLLEAFRQTGERKTLAAARGALRHAETAAFAAPFGFYSGQIGVAYAHTRFATYFDESEHLDRARQILAAIAGKEADDDHLDVIGGAAGAIPALLQIESVFGDGSSLEIASRLGNNLLRRARRGPRGWSWSTIAVAADDLLGYAHGAAGIATALAELAVATGDSRYAYASEQAVAYERTWFDPDRDNWPDLRHSRLSEFLDTRQQLSPDARRTAAEELLPYVPRFMSAWCHGASGIGLSRLRMLEITGEPSYKIDASRAVRCVRQAVADGAWQHASFSLCHGIAGDCEMLLDAGRILQDESSRFVALEIAAHASQIFEQRGVAWRSGAIGGVQDASFMLGDAGIGYFYLRLADPQVPSVILVNSPIRAKTSDNGAGAAALRSEDVEQHFGNTLRALDRVASFSLTSDSAGQVSHTRPEVSVTFDAIVQRIDREPDPRTRELLSDVFALERTRYELAASAPPRCDGLILEIKQAAAPKQGLRASRVRLGEHVRLTTSRFAWADWLASSRSLDDLEPAEHSTLVVWLKAGAVHSTTLAPFSALILRHIAEVDETTVDGAVERILSLFDLEPGVEQPPLQARVRNQVSKLLDAGILNVCGEPDDPHITH